MPKNQAPGRWVSNDWPPSTAPTTIAELPTSPRSAVRTTLSRRVDCPGASESTLRGGLVAVVVALGDTSSIGDSLLGLKRCFTAGAEIFMKLQ
jgi:hypothetical protein